MMKILYHKYLFFIFMFTAALFLYSCNQKEKVVAQVEDIEIDQDEFRFRYNFNPFLNKIEKTSQAKLTVLSALIAEKLLAVEAKQSDLNSAKINDLIQQVEWETMIEEIRQDSVERLIQINSDELKNEYDSSVKELYIRYIAISDSSEAYYLKSVIDSMGSFQEPVNEFMFLKGWGNSSIPSKKIIWAEEPLELEESAYQLSINQVSKPVYWRNEYYIMILDSVRSQRRSAADYLDKKSALEDRIRRRKINKLYKLFYSRSIAKNIGAANKQNIHELTDILVSGMQFADTDASIKQSAINKELKFDENRISESVLNTEIVSFPNGEVWNGHEFLKKMQRGPFEYNYSSEFAFKKSFYFNVKLLLELQSIYELAKKNSYQTKSSVQKEINTWNEYYTANEYRYLFLKEIQGLSQKDDSQNLSQLQINRLEHMDSHLAELVDKYNINIEKDNYENIILNKTDMVVSKIHYANRLMSPPLEPLTALTRYNKALTKVLDKYEIN